MTRKVKVGTLQDYSDENLNFTATLHFLHQHISNQYFNNHISRLKHFPDYSRRQDF